MSFVVAQFLLHVIAMNQLYLEL